MKTFDPRVIKVLMKTMYLGLFLNTLGPIIVMVLIVVLRGESFNFSRRMALPTDGGLLSLLYIAIALSLIVIVVTYLMRKKLFDAAICPDGKSRQVYFEERVMSISRLVYILNAMHAIFGLVLYSFGLPLEIMMLFTAGTLITYQFFRPRPRVLEQFYKKVVADSEE